jgi:ribosomal-protein-alanine N-acetyltransferase
MTVHILQAGSRDAAGMARVHKAGFAHPWDESSLRLMMERPTNLVLVALTGAGEVVGFVIARQAADEAEILTIATDPKQRRKGIGARLLEAAVELSRQRGITAMYLEVASGNKAAIALYERFGFTEVGRRQAYYQQSRKTPEDALLMRKPLTE